MNEAIKLAIENGGYFYSLKATERHQEVVCLDPLFWQALGKALGWGQNTSLISREVENTKIPMTGYLYSLARVHAVLAMSIPRIRQSLLARRIVLPRSRAGLAEWYGTR